MNKIKGIKYKAPLLDGSGYARAARDYVLALYRQGVPITVEPMTFEEARPDLGEDTDIIKDLIGKDIEYDVVIIHSTPEFWPELREEGKINCGYTIWETTKIHKDWPGYINNSVDMCMVATDWNVQVFRDCGVTVPMCTIPHISDTVDPDAVETYPIEGISDNTYVFGFVSQWQERKNPLALIKAYWQAFQKGEDVALVLKTYRSNYSDSEKNAIRQTIMRLKSVTVLDNYPSIYYMSNMLTENEMRGLYKRLDCYVSLDRGEGWGLSPFHAGAYGKPVIATGFGGVNAYLKEDNSYLVNYVLEPVFGMPWARWMTADQSWAYPDVADGVAKMREVYYNQEGAKAKGKKLQKYITENFNYEVVGAKIIKEIEDLL